jgi:hypothetical protein
VRADEATRLTNGHTWGAVPAPRLHWRVELRRALRLMASVMRTPSTSRTHRRPRRGVRRGTNTMRAPGSRRAAHSRPTERESAYFGASQRNSDSGLGVLFFVGVAGDISEGRNQSQGKTDAVRDDGKLSFLGCMSGLALCAHAQARRVRGWNAIVLALRSPHTAPSSPLTPPTRHPSAPFPTFPHDGRTRVRASSVRATSVRATPVRATLATGGYATLCG